MKQIDQVIEEAMNLHGKINLSIASLNKPLDEEQLEFYYFCEDHMPQILDELEKYEDSMHFYMNEFGKLQQQNQIMREVLKWYADERNYTHDENGNHICTAYMGNRVGIKAQEAIKKVSEV